LIEQAIYKLPEVDLFVTYINIVDPEGARDIHVPYKPPCKPRAETPPLHRRNPVGNLSADAKATVSAGKPIDPGSRIRGSEYSNLITLAENTGTLMKNGIFASQKTGCVSG
jgi:hypothetical protein